MLLFMTTACRQRRPQPLTDLEPIQTLEAQARRSRGSFMPSGQLMSWLKKSPQNVSFPGQVVSADDIVFIVMASIAERSRLHGQRSTWMRWTKHVVALADARDDQLGIMTLPEIENKTGFAEAQWRQLYGMKWLLTKRPDLADKAWFFLVDDDTWVNVPELIDYVSAISPKLPLSFSHIYLMYNNQAVYNGGAGMLFSNTAFQKLGRAVMTDDCPLTDVDRNFMNNDNILAACAFSTGVLKVSSSKFSTYEGVLHLHGDIIDTGWLDQISVHKVKESGQFEALFRRKQATTLFLKR